MSVTDTYDVEQLAAELKAIAPQISGKMITEIAYKENLGTTTIRNYLKGEIDKPAIAQAILNRCKALTSK